MWEKLRVIFTIPELRQKILLTLALLAIYRIGWHIPLPIINQETLKARAADTETGFGRMVEYAAVFSASDLKQATIFGLGIMPYISASIIFQLLGSVWKPIEDLQKEGEAGRKKINEYTRYLTVVLCLLQSWAYVHMYIMSTDTPGAPPPLVSEAFLSGRTNTLTFGWQLIAVVTMTCGTIFLMWLGEQIDEYGIGNGISLLIMAGIVARMPGAGWDLLKNAERQLVGIGSGRIGVETIVDPRFPVRRSGHRGRVYHAWPATHPHAERQACPGQTRLRRNPPVPAVEDQSVGRDAHHLRQQPAHVSPNALRLAGPTEWLLGDPYLGAAGRRLPPRPRVLLQRDVHRHDLLLLLLLDGHHFQSQGHGGKPEKLRHVHPRLPARETDGRLPGTGHGPHHLRRSRLLGPGGRHSHHDFQLAGSEFEVASFYGGTGLLIAVSVAFDLVQKIDSHLVMRNYRGLLESCAPPVTARKQP